MLCKTAIILLFASLAHPSTQGAAKPAAAPASPAPAGSGDYADPMGIVFDTIDTNNDQKVTFDEAKKFYLKMGANSTVIEDQFKKANTNGDKTLNLQEFGDFAECIGVADKMFQLDPLDVIFQVIDTNDDNKASLAEIEKTYGLVGVSKSVVDSAFKTANKENNGLLTRQEFDVFDAEVEKTLKPPPAKPAAAPAKTATKPAAAPAKPAGKPAGNGKA